MGKSESASEGLSVGCVQRDRGGEIKIVARSGTTSFLHEIMPV